MIRSSDRSLEGFTVLCEGGPFHTHSTELGITISHATPDVPGEEDSRSFLSRHWQHVSWHKSVKDVKNQKTSKKCCIYHKSRSFDESSSEDEEAQHDPSKCSKESCYCHTRFS
mmetsp:Transcript_32820/g.51300  ORF Transcript_32820/g.51300 Transcript_32820/m.51300 type:complete len:113 (-) Transcript_32820:60-398(-)